MDNVHKTLTALFTATADAIREKTGSTDAIVADEFPTKISEISVGISAGTTGAKFGNGVGRISDFELMFCANNDPTNYVRPI